MRNKRFLFMMVSVLAFAVVIAGCSSKNMSTNEMAPNVSMDYDRGQTQDSPSAGIDMNQEEKSEYTMVEPDKIITTVSVSMQTKEFVDTTEKLTNLIGKYKGYIENSNISHNNYYNSTRLKHAEYTIRIPRENLSHFTLDLKGIGNIISENTSKVDITKQYRDTESRLKVLELKEERILALLNKAEKMEDIIVLENQLSSIIYDKENLTANILDMDDKVDYSSLYLNIEEVAKLTSEEDIKTTFWTKIVNAFKDSTYFFSYNIQGLIIWFIYFIPYGLIIGVIAFVVLRFIKKRRTPKE